MEQNWIPANSQLLGIDYGAITHNAIIYQYPCGNYDIVASSAGDFMEPGFEMRGKSDVPRPSAREAGVKSSGDDMLRSMRRARAKVRRLALANTFRWFVTLTLDAARIDRYDPKIITKALSTWADNMARRHGLAYILVPERHRDGAIHFHGFFSDNVEAVASGHKDSKGHMIYNLPQWKLGFTAAIELYGDYPCAVAYCCKYIGKQNGDRPMGRWYYSGGPLEQPVKIYADLDYQSVKTDYMNSGVALPLPGKELFVAHVSPTPAAPSGAGRKAGTDKGPS